MNYINNQLINEMKEKVSKLSEGELKENKLYQNYIHFNIM